MQENDENGQDDELGAGRLVCCGWEPDPVLVVILLAQMIHIAVGVLLWLCFWRRLCIASCCYGAMMLHEVSTPGSFRFRNLPLNLDLCMTD